MNKEPYAQQSVGWNHYPFSNINAGTIEVDVDD